ARPRPRAIAGRSTDGRAIATPRGAGRYSAMDDGVPDFFGSEADIAGLEAELAVGAAGAARRIELAWYQRQRDTRAALGHANAAEADAAALPAGERERALGRLALVRAEAAWLFSR